MPKIKGISHIVLYVNDLDKMVAFYQDVLGLIKYHEHPGRMVFMTPDPEIDDHQLALVKGREGDAKLIAHITPGVSTRRRMSRNTTNASKRWECQSTIASVTLTSRWATPFRAISLIPRGIGWRSMRSSQSAMRRASTGPSTWTRLCPRSSPRQADSKPVGTEELV